MSAIVAWSESANGDPVDLVAEQSGRARGLTVRQALGASALAGAHVLAGASGLDRIVERMNVMEVPDILPWVKPREFLLTTAYPLRESPEVLADLVAELDRRDLSGLGIKVGRYLDAVPAAMLDRADALGFPIVRLPDGVGFDDILNEVLADVLHEQAAALARAERVHRTLVQIVLSGGGLDEIARDLAALLGAACVLVDADGRVVADGGEGARAVLERLGLADGAGCVRLDHPDGSVVASGDDEPGAAADGAAAPARGPGWLRVPIAVGPRVLGHILALDGPRPLAGDALPALENAATVAALAITRSSAVAAVESRHRSEWLHDLLSGRIGTDEEAVGRAAALGWALDRPLVVLVVRRAAADGPARGSGPRTGPRLDRIAQALHEAASARDPGAATVALRREVVVITGAEEALADASGARAFADAVRLEAEAASGVRLRVGVSRPIASTLAVPGAFEQAGNAERVGAELGAVVCFDDLGAFRLLSLVSDADELERYVADVLGPLAGDGAEAKDLRRTLRMLLGTGLNVAESARRLHFHYNTMRYRVAKLETLLGPFTRDADVRFDVELALQVLRLRGRS